MNQTETVQVPIEWFKGLKRIIENIDKTQGTEKLEWQSYLIGYLRSSQAFVK